MNNLNARLIGREELLRLYPALASKGKNKYYRLQWLTRSRQIPVVRIGRRLYYDPIELQSYIESKKIPAIGNNK
jgi:hypothetical protein